MLVLKTAFFFLIAYLLGSIPCGLLIARRYQVDIGQVGSKNPGATNVLRTVGKTPAIFTLLGDMFKGAASVFLGKIFFSSPALVGVMGLLAIIGHDWSVFNRFKGGKGVATSLGVFLVLTPYPLLLALAIWLLVLSISRYVSLASVSAALALPVFVFFFYGAGFLFILALIAGILLIFKHRSNIQRLRAGAENRLGQRS